MSISMGLRHKTSGEYREVPIASSCGFAEGWLPFCHHLGLQFVPLFSGGALTAVPADLVPEILRELRLLLVAVEVAPNGAWIAERVRGLLAAFAATDPAEWEYDFG
ncbi:MAG: hypothetical protein J0I06_26280 [Planctomycetes bacterium]|nr:hypothetical protein [Planctomycetota bacterium]